jgi:hypothetical protein
MTGRGGSRVRLAAVAPRPPDPVEALVESARVEVERVQEGFVELMIQDVAIVELVARGRRRGGGRGGGAPRHRF